MSGLLAGKSILVTGAASGIGLATARLAAQEGASVTLADRSREAGEKALARVLETGAKAQFVWMDVTNETQVGAGIAAAVQAYGVIDGAFNNAGISTNPASPAGEKAADIPEEAWHRVLDVNLTGVWRCMRAEVRQMLVLGTKGAIVNNASVGGLVGLRGHAVYAASKHAVVGLSKSAAADYARAGIRINAICPGVIATPLNTVLLEQVADKAVEGVPVKRFGQPEEIAQAVIWLLSERASFVTGAAIAADGGYTSV